MKKIVLTAVIFTASSGMVVSASEALQIGYDFNAQNGNPTQTDSSATLSVATLSGGDFRGFFGSGNPGFAAVIGSEGGGATMTTLEFTVTPSSQLSLTNFSYDVSSSFSVEVFSSLDGFASALNSYIPPTFSYTTQSFGLSSFNNILSPVTFRIRQPSSTLITLDNVRLDFTTATPVPFEFSPAVGIGVLGGLWAGRKILKKSLKPKS